MRVAFVLRVDPDLLLAGTVHGEIEEVASGRVGALRSWDDVVRFCRAAPPAVHPGISLVEQSVQEGRHV